MREKVSFDFNHIDYEKLSEEEITTLKEFYRHYHKKFWCFRKLLKQLKQLNLLMNLSSSLCIVVGTIVGGVTINPV